MRRLLISLPTFGQREFRLRELDGVTELLVDPDDPDVVPRLLRRLLAEPPGADVEVDVAGLLCAWRDRLFATIFEREFGGRVESQARCDDCGEEYEFGFELAAAMRAQYARATTTCLSLDDEGRIAVDGDAWVRPPTVGDIAQHLDPDALAEALCGGTLSRARVEEVLEEAAPLLAFDLETRCPWCEKAQVFAFDIVTHTLESLASERPLLIREAHLIASSYGWGHDTIMELSRSDRRAYAGLILSERTSTGARSVE